MFEAVWSPVVLSCVKLPCVTKAKAFVMVHLMSESSSRTLGAGLVPSISSGGMRYPRRLNMYPFLFSAGGMIWHA